MRHLSLLFVVSLSLFACGKTVGGQRERPDDEPATGGLGGEDGSDGSGGSSTGGSSSGGSDTGGSASGGSEPNGTGGVSGCDHVAEGDPMPLQGPDECPYYTPVLHPLTDPVTAEGETVVVYEMESPNPGGDVYIHVFARVSQEPDGQCLLFVHCQGNGPRVRLDVKSSGNDVDEMYGSAECDVTWETIQLRLNCPSEEAGGANTGTITDLSVQFVPTSSLECTSEDFILSTSSTQFEVGLPGVTWETDPFPCEEW